MSALKDIEAIKVAYETVLEANKLSSQELLQYQINTAYQIMINLMKSCAPVFDQPAFLSHDLPVAERKWPCDYRQASRAKLSTDHLAAVGAIMLEWAFAERLFDGSLNHLGNLEPIKESGVLRDLKLYNFKTKRKTWLKATILEPFVIRFTQ